MYSVTLDIEDDGGVLVVHNILYFSNLGGDLQDKVCFDWEGGEMDMWCPEKVKNRCIFIQKC